ncbi:MAG: FHA domain-containing protein [Calditrichia bacterium]
MHAKLICQTGSHIGSKFVIGEEAIIGRDAVNDITIVEPTITNTHVRIFLDAQQGCYFIEDLGSRNGTTVDGVSISGRQRLEKMHVITLARKVDLIFVLSKKALPELQLKKNGNRLGETPALRQTAVEDSAFSLPRFNRSPDAPDPKQTHFGDGFDD